MFWELELDLRDESPVASYDYADTNTPCLCVSHFKARLNTLLSYMDHLPYCSQYFASVLATGSLSSCSAVCVASSYDAPRTRQLECVVLDALRSRTQQQLERQALQTIL